MTGAQSSFSKCSPPVLSADDLSFSYKDGPPLFSHLSLSVSGGEVVGLTGESGCGKTTLCYCLCGIIPHIFGGILSGSVCVRGGDISKMRQADICRDINIVFQNPDIQLFSTAAVDDIVFGLENFCVPREEIEKRLRGVSELLGIDDLLGKNPNRLSGGQKQLCAIASVLVLDPAVLIFDEALSRLDGEGKYAVLSAIARLRGEGKGIIMVEHRMENLLNADRVLRMEGGRLV